MTERNRRLVLAERPTGLVDGRTVRLEDGPLPTPGRGEALVKVRYLSIDPTIRTWMDEARGYLPPIGIDEVIRSGGIGEVIASESPRYDVGTLVFGMLGWQDYAIVDENRRGAQPIPPDVDPPIALNVFGVTGMTAYFGLLDVGAMVEDDVVVVSGAAGATGSVVGQIAKLQRRWQGRRHSRRSGQVCVARRRPRPRRGNRLSQRERRRSPGRPLSEGDRPVFRQCRR